MSWTQTITDGVRELWTYADEPIIQAAVILLIGLIAGYILGRVTIRLLRLMGMDHYVEGTATERWMQRMRTSTVVALGRLVSVFIYIGAILSAMLILGVLHADVFWELATAWLPHLFVAVVIFVVGVLLADKLEIVVGERLEGIKLPEVGIIPGIVKYTVVFIAVLIALGQIGVHTTALLILLTVYFVGLLLILVIALQDFLASASAGIFLLLREPYAIGDEIHVDGAEGIVQEVTIFVTKIEADDEEYIVPNRQIIKHGFTRRRN